MIRKIVARFAAGVAAVLLAVLLPACGGSQRSTGDFATAVRALCTRYTAEQAAISRRLLQEKPPATRVLSTIRDFFAAIDRWLAQLRQLSPPTSSGVSVDEWQAVIDRPRLDARDVEAFYAKWFPKLLLSFQTPNGKPNLPSGAGAPLAQAFLSPEGEKILRLQQQLLHRTQADASRWEQIARKVGIDETCLGNVATPIAPATETPP